MSAQTLPGRRVADANEVWHGQAGDYAVADRHVWVRTPADDVLRIPRGDVADPDQPAWSFEEHEDGTVTLSPSIFVNPQDDPPGWHGFLEHGIWRTA